MSFSFPHLKNHYKPVMIYTAFLMSLYAREFELNYIEKYNLEEHELMNMWLVIAGLLCIGIWLEYRQMCCFVDELFKMIFDHHNINFRKSGRGLFVPFLWSIFLVTFRADTVENNLNFFQDFFCFLILFSFLGAILEIHDKLSTTDKIIMEQRKHKIANLKNVSKAIFALKSNVIKFYSSDRVYDFFEEDTGEWKVKVKYIEKPLANRGFIYQC